MFYQSCAAAGVTSRADSPHIITGNRNDSIKQIVLAGWTWSVHDIQGSSVPMHRQRAVSVQCLSNHPDIVVSGDCDSQQSALRHIGWIGNEVPLRSIPVLDNWPLSIRRRSPRPTNSPCVVGGACDNRLHV